MAPLPTNQLQSQLSDAEPEPLAVEAKQLIARRDLEEIEREVRLKENASMPITIACEAAPARTPSKQADSDINTLPSQVDRLKLRMAPKPQLNFAGQADAEKWYEDVEVALDGPAAMQHFPKPPSNIVVCSNEDCRARASVLGVCRCNIKATYKLLEDVDLELEHYRWSPLNLVVHDVEKLEEFMKMAQEICDALYELMGGPRRRKRVKSGSE